MPPRDRDAAKRAARDAAKRARDIEETEQAIAAKESALGGVGAIINDPDFYHSHPNPQAVFSEFAKLKDENQALQRLVDMAEAKGGIRHGQ